MLSIVQNVFQLFFLLGYVVLFVISILIVKPFRVHRRRPVSTISLKLSYLVFFAVFLVFIYLLLFGDKKQLDDGEIPYDTLFNIHFIFFLTSTIVPNIGIMLRKRVKKSRVVYNVIFTGINTIYSIYLIWAVAVSKWAQL